VPSGLQGRQEKRGEKKKKNVSKVRRENRQRSEDLGLGTQGRNGKKC